MKNDAVTMIDKIKISRSKVEIVWLFLLLAIFTAIMVIIGGLQYIVCLDRNPKMAIKECFSLTPNPAVKRPN